MNSSSNRIMLSVFGSIYEPVVSVTVSLLDHEWALSMRAKTLMASISFSGIVYLLVNMGAGKNDQKP